MNRFKDFVTGGTFYALLFLFLVIAIENSQPPVYAFANYLRQHYVEFHGAEIDLIIQDDNTVTIHYYHPLWCDYIPGEIKEGEVHIFVLEPQLTEASAEQRDSPPATFHAVVH